MARHDGGTDPDQDTAEEVDLSEVSSAQLRDRLAARSDGRDDRVVAAAHDLRASLDRLADGLAARRAAVLGRAGEIARAAVPWVGGAAATGLGAVLLTRGARRRRRERRYLTRVAGA
ncbi:hypothetical protein [Pseudonocardia spirodelae]|uniref:DUF3618 domain-containing protein n=1 Tax=Pseudonocardia spirodelae TaxID=3133431 RepID=A0ABU8T1U1_9PSEU